MAYKYDAVNVIKYFDRANTKTTLTLLYNIYKNAVEIKRIIDNTQHNYKSTYLIHIYNTLIYTLEIYKCDKYENILDDIQRHNISVYNEMIFDKIPIEFYDFFDKILNNIINGE